MKALLVVLLLLVGLAVVADRVAEQVAEGVVARQIEGELGVRPEVEVGGFPFLTQAIGGRYQEITVDAPQVRRGDVTVQDVRATLTGTQVPLSDVVGGSLSEVPVDGLRGSGLVPWSTLEGATGDRLRLEAEGEQVRVSGTVSALGQSVEGSALATPSVDGSDLRLQAGDVTVDGAPVPGPVAQALSAALSLTYQVPPLPYDLRLREVDVTEEGVVVTGAADDVLLRR